METTPDIVEVKAIEHYKIYLNFLMENKKYMI